MITEEVLTAAANLVKDNATADSHDSHEDEDGADVRDCLSIWEMEILAGIGGNMRACYSRWIIIWVYAAYICWSHFSLTYAVTYPRRQ